MVHLESVFNLEMESKYSFDFGLMAYLSSYHTLWNILNGLFYNPEKISCWFLVRIGVVHHEPGPLRHLAQVPVRVVEILDRGQISLGGQAGKKWQ